MRRKKKRLTKKLTPARYKELIHKRVSKKKLTKRQKKQLDHELMVNYCKCLKKLHADTRIDKGSEYPLCASSVYIKRGFDVPKGVTKQCRNLGKSKKMKGGGLEPNSCERYIAVITKLAADKEEIIKKVIRYLVSHSMPAEMEAVSYTHLTLPTKRIV